MSKLKIFVIFCLFCAISTLVAGYASEQDNKHYASYLCTNISTHKLRSANKITEIAPRTLIEDAALKSLQLSLNLATKVCKTLTGTHIRSTIEKSLRVLPLPGKYFIASTIGFGIGMIYNVCTNITSSQFMNNTGGNNLKNLLLDIVKTILIEVYQFNEAMINGVTCMFNETNSIKLHIIENPTSIILKNLITIIHTTVTKCVKIFTVLVEKLGKIQSNANDNATSSIYVISLMNTIFEEDINLLRTIIQDISNTPFMINKPNWENFPSFLLITFKSILVKILEKHKRLLITAIQKLQKPSETALTVQAHDKLVKSFTPGIAIRVINTFIDKLKTKTVLYIPLVILRHSSRFLHTLFKHDTIDFVFKLVPSFIRKYIFCLTDKIDSFARLIQDSNFLSDPSWDKFIEMLRDVIKHIINILRNLISFLQSRKSTNPISIVIIKFIVPGSVLRSISNFLKIKLSIVVNATYSDKINVDFLNELSGLIGEYIKYIGIGLLNIIHDFSKNILQKKFFEEPNAETTVEILHFIPKLIVSLVLQRAQHGLEYILSNL